MSAQPWVLVGGVGHMGAPQAGRSPGPGCRLDPPQLLQWVFVSSWVGPPGAGTPSQAWVLTWLHPSVPQLWAADRSPSPLAGRWGGDRPSPPSPVQVPEGDTHERNFGRVLSVPACSAPAWSRGEGAAGALLLLLLLQIRQRAPAGRATPLPCLQSRVDTKNSGASQMELWSLRVCWLPLDVVLG